MTTIEFRLVGYQNKPKSQTLLGVIGVARNGDKGIY